MYSRPYRAHSAVPRVPSGWRITMAMGKDTDCLKRWSILHPACTQSWGLPCCPPCAHSSSNIEHTGALAVMCTRLRTRQRPHVDPCCPSRWTICKLTPGFSGRCCLIKLHQGQADILKRQHVQQRSSHMHEQLYYFWEDLSRQDLWLELTLWPRILSSSRGW